MLTMRELEEEVFYGSPDCCHHCACCPSDRACCVSVRSAGRCKDLTSKGFELKTAISWLVQPNVKPTISDYNFLLYLCSAIMIAAIAVLETCR